MFSVKKVREVYVRKIKKARYTEVKPSKFSRSILVNKIRKGSYVGDGLLSHTVARTLPSTLVDLTTGFDMEPGVPPPLLPPTKLPLLTL